MTSCRLVRECGYCRETLYNFYPEMEAVSWFLLPRTESHNNIKVTLTVVKPQEVLCVRSLLNAVENCEILKKKVLEKHIKFLRPLVRVATVKSCDIMKVKNALTYKLDRGVHYMKSYFSYY
jgi:hypothetical protein